MIQTIALGCDHAGFIHKDLIAAHLKARGIHVLNFGADSAEAVDYADFAHPVANAVEQGEAQMGILLCGSGNGVAMTANKHKGIRAALCWMEEIARLARQHNDANVLAIPARFVSGATALAMVDIFLDTPFEGGRHERRVRKI
ncbi:MAG: ribose 5-phosphate isomerase B [Saprospiraceae bacterium]